MKRQEVKIDGSKILLSLFKKYKDEPWVLSSREVYDKINSLFSNLEALTIFELFQQKKDFESVVQVIGLRAMPTVMNNPVYLNGVGANVYTAPSFVSLELITSGKYQIVPSYGGFAYTLINE